MTAHIIADITLANPIKCAFQKILAGWHCLLYMHSILDVGVLAIAELRFGKRHKRARIHCIE